MYFTFGIILNGYGIALLLTCWHRGYQVEHELVVYFEVGNADRVLIIKPTADLLENL